MRPVGFPQVSVVVDLLGDVYLYREAGSSIVPARGATSSAASARRDHSKTSSPSSSHPARRSTPLPGDTAYFDIFDHVVTMLLNQADDDERFGVPFEQGPVRDRIQHGANPHGPEFS